MVGSDGRSRPLLTAKVEYQQQTTAADMFLVDSGADQTVLPAQVWRALGSRVSSTSLVLGGIGGTAVAYELQATIILTDVLNNPIRITGPFAFHTVPGALDMCVLGRDVTDLFDLVLSRRKGHVLLLAPNHSYQIVHS